MRVPLRLSAILLAAAPVCGWAQESDPAEALIPQIVQQQAEPSPTVPVQALDAPEDGIDPERRPAFEAAVDSLLPLRPEEIRELLLRLNESQEAASAPVGGVAPAPLTRVQTVSLDPGTLPPEILVSTGYVSSVSFLDATGQPWPILDVVYGGAFELPAPDEGSHILRIIPQTRHGSGNLSVRLQGLSTPLTFRVKAGIERVDFRLDIRVPEYGPNAQAPLIDRGIAAVDGDGVLMTVLEGSPPDDAIRLTVDGADSRTRAYRVGDRLILRTPMQLLSPGWQQSVSSADGMQVYALADTPVLLLSDNGVMIRARIGEPLLGMR